MYSTKYRVGLKRITILLLVGLFQLVVYQLESASGAMSETEKLRHLSIDKDWTLPMIKDFITTLMKATLCTDIHELKNHAITECVWRKVGQDMKIDHNSLKNVWYYRLHMQLFCTEPIYFNDVKIKLILYLHGNDISSSKDIKWLKVLDHFNGYTLQFLYRIFIYLVRFAKSKIGTSVLPDIVHYLNDTQIPNIKQNLEDKILPRLMYENGNVKHIDIDVQEWMSLQNTASEFSDSSSEEE